MMPTTRQDFWVLYFREIMMRPRSSRDLSSVLLTCSDKNDRILETITSVRLQQAGIQTAEFSLISRISGIIIARCLTKALISKMLLIHVDNKIITWKCSHSVSHGFNSAFKSQEFFFVFLEIRSSYSSSPSCLENQPNTDWLIDVISVVDGALIASSRLICHLLYRQDKHLK